MHDDQPPAARAVTLLGAGPVDTVRLNQALLLAPTLIAADGGANHAHRLGLPVTRIVGDLDSSIKLEFWREQGVPVDHVPEQNSTDFEKCLYRVQADLYIGVGFLGRRLDHTLAALRSLAAYPDKTVVLLGDGDLVFLAPDEIDLDLAAGTPVSIFPLGRTVCGRSAGLRWPLDGLVMEPDGQIGTSNEATGGPVSAHFEGARPLMILPENTLGQVVRRLMSGP